MSRNGPLFRKDRFGQDKNRQQVEVILARADRLQSLDPEAVKDRPVAHGDRRQPSLRALKQRAH